MKRMEPINNGRSRVPKQHAPAGKTISQPVYKAVPPHQEPTGLGWNPQNRASMDQNTQAHQQARNGLQMLSDAAMGPGPAPPAVMPQPQQWIQPMSQPQMLPGVTEIGMHNQGMMPYGMPGQELGPMDFTSDELMAFGFGDEFLAMNFGFEQGNWI